MITNINDFISLNPLPLKNAESVPEGVAKLQGFLWLKNRLIVESFDTRRFLWRGLVLCLGDKGNSENFIRHMTAGGRSWKVTSYETIAFGIDFNFDFRYVARHLMLVKRVLSLAALFFTLHCSAQPLALSSPQLGKLCSEKLKTTSIEEFALGYEWLLQMLSETVAKDSSFTEDLLQILSQSQNDPRLFFHFKERGGVRFGQIKTALEIFEKEAFSLFSQEELKNALSQVLRNFIHKFSDHKKELGLKIEKIKYPDFYLSPTILWDGHSEIRHFAVAGNIIAFLANADDLYIEDQAKGPGNWRKLPLPPRSIDQVLILPKNQEVVTSTYDEINFYDLSTGKKKGYFSFKDSEGEQHFRSFSPFFAIDENLILLPDQGAIYRLWNRNDGKVHGPYDVYDSSNRGNYKELAKSRYQMTATIVGKSFLELKGARFLNIRENEARVFEIKTDDGASEVIAWGPKQTAAGAISPDGKRIALLNKEVPNRTSRDDFLLQIYDVEEMKKLGLNSRPFFQQKVLIYYRPSAMAFVDNTRVLVGTDSGLVLSFDTSTIDQSDF